MLINDEDYTPSYIKIQNFILEKIQNGEFQTGNKIPSEQELSQMFSVSRVTANRAINELSIIGVVSRIKGKGTFVCEPHSHTASKVLFPNIQIKPFLKKEHHLIRSIVVEAYPELLERFQLKEKAQVFEIVRSVDHQGKLMALDYSYIPYDLVHPAAITTEEISNTYIHEFLRSNTNCVPCFVELYINTPRYRFLDFGEAFGTEAEQLILWTTDVLDNNRKLLASTITIAPGETKEQPFIKFSIE